MEQRQSVRWFRVVQLRGGDCRHRQLPPGGVGYARLFYVYSLQSNPFLCYPLKGFLRPSIDAHNIANYALLDQIAALHWIKENIEAFGGDNGRVTLMGHSTGAACVNYLMVSPVASGESRVDYN